jgi:hypothetical protein
MTTPNFASILDESPSEVNRPKPLPAGTYICTVNGQPVYDRSAKKGTPYVQFNLRPISAEDDVDEAELVEVLFDKEGNETELASKNIKAVFYTTEDAIFRLDEFHQHCGIDLNDEASRRTRNDQVVNASVRAVIKHRTSDDGQSIFSELARTLPAD